MADVTKEELLKGELEFIEDNIAYLQTREDDMNGDLSSLLNMLTLLPMCEKEYSENAAVFRKYRYLFEAFERLEMNLEEYGFKLLIPKFVYDYYGIGECETFRNHNNNRNHNHNLNHNHKNKK